FFFQAEDGIRDRNVTGVQTCALPISDRRVVRLIQKWMRAGVLEDGKRIRTEEGTPQGGRASPLLANVYLHYVFDLWVQAWRQKRSEERRVGKEWRVGRETWE